MFYCTETGKITQPGQKMIRVVVRTRGTTYFNREGEVIGTGSEIVRETPVGAPVVEPTEVRPLIAHEGKDQDKTVDLLRHRAVKEGRTVYITSHRGPGGHNVMVVLGITPHGDVFEIPPSGLAVGMFEHLQQHFVHWAATDNRSSVAQKQKHMGALAQMARIFDEATKAKAS